MGGALPATFAPDLLRGKTAFVAGGTSGVNLGVAHRFADLGARVAVLGRKPDKAQAAAAEIGRGARAYTADVRDYPAVEAALAQAAGELGPFDILLAGQAGNFVAPALGMSANAFKAVVDIDLLGTFNLFRAGWEHLVRPGASLIAITAGQAVNPTALQSHVCAAKAGINMLVKCLALEWGPMGVRVNAITPGPTENTEGMARLAPTEALRAAVRDDTPLRRYGRADEIGDAAVYLSSPAAAYVTGTVLDVDGGSTLNGFRLPNLLEGPAHG
jgi:NAD(P)-dependent dehydrogenase (short-subunit alcohol dehydrogenase family)